MEAPSQGKEEGEQRATAPQGSTVSVSPCRGASCLRESPDSTANFTCMKTRPVLLDPEPGQGAGTVVAAGAGPEAKGWS